MRTVGPRERRSRLGVRHALAGALAGTPAEAARRVVALHATDPASVFLAVRARTDGLTPADIEHALYTERRLVRMLGMRGTVWVVPVALAPVVQASSTLDVARRQRARYGTLLRQAGLGDDAWMAGLEAAAEAALLARGEATGAQLSADEPLLRTRIRLAEGKSYSGEQNMTTWVLSLLASDGRIVRGRPRGSWVSSQYSWTATASWLPGGLPELDPAAARVELVRGWLAAFGPGTVADLRWWTGWTAGQVKQALACIGPIEVDLGGVIGLVLPDDEEPVGEPEPWVALLPALDPTAMGWQEREFYLGEHGPALFDRSGNIGPTVWCDGRIVGGWAHRPDGAVGHRLLEDVGAEVAGRIAQEAARLEGWIGPVRVTPRFRTPLERELSS